MHRSFSHFHRFSAAATAVLLVLLVACTSNGDSSADTPTGGPADSLTVARTDSPAARRPWPSGQPVEQSEWVQDRLSAVKQIYGFTPAGEEWIDGYDFRQMIEQPAWFGSHGYTSWAGAGEAVPRSILHEISHSYWGAFSVAGSPDVTWTIPQGGSQTDGLLQYREQLRRFMLQPPDRFEPLRDRFRNLPGLDSGHYPDLFHFGEAELLYFAGGNLQLIPPTLLPYYSGYLASGGVRSERGGTFASWDAALAWFDSLSDNERRIAGELFGLQHFPVGNYVNLPESEHEGLENTLHTLYANEERQRLIDFSEQFDGILEREFSLLDAIGADRGFDFWRAYLFDKLDLHQRHSGVLRNLGTQRGTELADALDFYVNILRFTAAGQAERYRAARNLPWVTELAVLLQPRAIVDLFSGADGDNGISSVLGRRADRLLRLVNVVDETARLHASSGTYAAAELLGDFVLGLPEDELRADSFLLLELLRSSDPGVAVSVLPALSDETLLHLLEIQPAMARVFEIQPQRLLSAVGIDAGARLEDVRAGATLLAANSSGNFEIDAPYDEAVFVHLDRFAESDPAGVLDAVVASGMRMAPWVTRQTDGAIVAMRGAPEASAEALASFTGTRETPWRIIHLVARQDPALAAKLVIELDRLADGPENALERTIREFGYEQYWSERRSGSGIPVWAFARFLLALAEERSMDQLSDTLANVREQIESEIQSGHIEVDAVTEFRRTADAAIKWASGDDARTLEEMFEGTGLR